MIDTINTVLFWICFYVLLWNGYFLLFNKGIPNITTAPAIRRKIVEILREDCASQGNGSYNVIDLGAGNGSLTRSIARGLPQAQVTGIDICSIANFKARMMMRLSGLRNLEHKRADFYDCDISKADAVVMFLLGSLMGRIREKLESDLKDGTLVISNKFPVGGDWVPLAEIDVRTLYPHQKKLFIYRKGMVDKRDANDHLMPS